MYRIMTNNKMVFVLNWGGCYAAKITEVQGQKVFISTVGPQRKQKDEESSGMPS